MIAARVARSDLPDRERIAALLRAGGTVAALREGKPAKFDASQP